VTSKAQQRQTWAEQQQAAWQGAGDSRPSPSGTPPVAKVTAWCGSGTRALDAKTTVGPTASQPLNSQRASCCHELRSDAGVRRLSDCRVLRWVAGVDMAVWGQLRDKQSGRLQQRQRPRYYSLGVVSSGVKV